jgi:hypothetical protein
MPTAMGEYAVASHVLAGLIYPIAIRQSMLLVSRIYRS